MDIILTLALQGVLSQGIFPVVLLSTGDIDIILPSITELNVDILVKVCVVSVFFLATFPEHPNRKVQIINVIIPLFFTIPNIAIDKTQANKLLMSTNVYMFS